MFRFIIYNLKFYTKCFLVNAVDECIKTQLVCKCVPFVHEAKYAETYNDVKHNFILFFGPCIFNNEDKKYTNEMHKLILDITDQSLQHVSAPQSKPSSGSSKPLRVTKPLY